MTRPFGMQFTSKSEKELYAKGTFQNVFPLALLAWMTSRGIFPHYAYGIPGAQPSIEVEDYDGIYVFDEHDPSRLHYSFEQEFAAFAHLQSGDSKQPTRLDVVATDPLNPTKQVRALENKLTVLPDISTSRNPENEWAPEMVIRPSSLAGASMSVFLHLNDDQKRALTEHANALGLGNIRDWRNLAEIQLHMDSIRNFVKVILNTCSKVQTPFLLQPFWATNGMSTALHERAFDMLVWTDHALLTAVYRASLDKNLEPKRKDGIEIIGRPQRAVVRMAATFAALAWKGSFNYDSIFRDISYNDQTDKELSINGRKMLTLIPSTIFAERRIPISDIFSILPRDAFVHFRPERRLDVALFVHETTAEL